MRFDEKKPPRQYEVGSEKKFFMKDCGTLRLEPDEQVTFTTEAGGEYDLARKDWGFYATPSLNARLTQFGLHGVLVKNRIGRYFVLLREAGREREFQDYIDVEQLEIICWMDDDASLQRLERAVKDAARGE
jgi:hypothetical protein